MPNGSLRERYALDSVVENTANRELWAQNGSCIVGSRCTTHGNGRVFGNREGNDAGILIMLAHSPERPAARPLRDVPQNSRWRRRAATAKANARKWIVMDPTGSVRRTADYRDGVLHRQLAAIQWKSRSGHAPDWKNVSSSISTDHTPFPVPREIQLTQLRLILGTEMDADPADAKSRCPGRPCCACAPIANSAACHRPR
jgi:hypothetical protein